MHFKYKAKNASGEVVTNVVEADSKAELFGLLHKQDLSLIAVEEGSSRWNMSINISFLRRVKIHEKVVFARNLAAMLNAGLSLSRALAIMGKQTRNAYFKEIIGKVEDAIRTGSTFHDALSLYPRVFPAVFASMVAAGEESGKLAVSLLVVASQLEKSYLIGKKIKGALMYPGIIITAMLGIGVFMLVYVVPTLTSTFRELKVDLPWSTKLIIFISDSLQRHLLLVIAAAAVLCAAAYGFLRTKIGKRAADFAVLHLPVIGNLVKETYAARTSRTLSSLLSSGVSMVESLRITSDVLQNSYYKEILAQATSQVQVGAPISEVFSKASAYPVYMGEMMAVGEETGELGTMLERVAEFFEEEVEQKTKDMSTIIEPVLMLTVGVAVGFFALSMITPMYSIANNI